MFHKNSIKLACRVCLTTEAYNIIMDNENGWLELFEYCFGFQINPKDQARSLCKECADNIRKFTKFKQKCLKSAFLWKSKNCLKPEFKMKLRSTNKDSVKVETDSKSASVDCQESIESHNKRIDSKLFESDQENDTIFETDNLIYSQEQYNIKHAVDNGDNSKCKIKEVFINKTDENEINTISQQSVELCKDDKCSTNPNDVINNLAAVREKLCCRCGRQYNYELNYNKHIRKCFTVKFFTHKMKNEDVLEQCGLCEFSTQDIEVLCKHLDNHFKRNDLECQLCDYTGRDFAEMAYHRYTHMPETKLHCLKCHKRFITPQSLQFHFRSVHLKQKGVFCSFCGLILSNVLTLKKHVKRKHTDVNILNKADSLFVCDCCGLRFVYRYEIVTHLRQRAGLTKCVCNVCGMSFARQQNLNSHIKNKHVKQEKVKCPICLKTCKSDFIKKHIQIIHGEKTLVCELCSDKFSTKTNLRYHMLGHTSERPYKCDKCAADYKTKSMLRVHMMKHSGVKPYTCNICQKSFYLLQLLRRHNSVHTNERPHKCRQCDRSFHFKKRLMEHCAIAHLN